MNPPHPPGDQQWPPAPGAPASPKKRPQTKAVTGIAVALTLLCCGGAALIAAVSSNSTSTPDATHTTAVQAAGAGAATVVAWRDDGGLGLITKLASDFAEIQGAGKKSGGILAQSAALHTACGHLQTDVESAQGFKQIPDGQAQTAWAKALALYARGSTDCISGTDRTDAALVSRAADEIGQGSEALNQVSDRMTQLAG